MIFLEWYYYLTEAEILDYIIVIHCLYDKKSMYVYPLNKITMKKKLQGRENVHHLIWKHCQDQYKVEAECNKIKMNMCRHNALHALFWMLLTPKEQLLELRHLYDTVLNDTARELFDELLALDDIDFYQRDVLKNKFLHHKWKKDGATRNT